MQEGDRFGEQDSENSEENNIDKEDIERGDGE
jgi:hypothetical protein